MKKLVKRIVSGIIACACALSVMATVAPSTEAEAATGKYYKRMFNSVGNEFETSFSAPVKVGNYYMKFKKASNYVLVYKSKLKYGPYTKTAIEDFVGYYYDDPSGQMRYDNFDVYTNGTNVYYTRMGVLYKYSVSTGKHKKITSLKYRGYDDVKISAVSTTGRISFTYSKNDFTFATYVLNLKNKKMTLFKKGMVVIGNYKNYVLLQTPAAGVGSPTTIWVARFNPCLKKVKTITNYGDQAAFKNGKIIYSKYTDTRSSKVKVCKCTVNGNHKTAISKTFKEAYITDIGSKTCRVNKFYEPHTYKYTYATRKLTRVN